MKKMATILAMLLITVLALSPIACNSGGEETPETPPAGRPSPAPTPTSTQNAPATPVDVIEQVENDPPITIPTVALDEEQPTAVLAIDSLIVTPELVLPGEETIVEAVITNVGDATGPCSAIL
ncbi:MAG: hypothetical protein GY845_10560 [Planctomycetes bacterium]|nr:hypothetical protein [Planctomycetota bacterium]